METLVQQTLHDVANRAVVVSVRVEKQRRGDSPAAEEALIAAGVNRLARRRVELRNERIDLLTLDTLPVHGRHDGLHPGDNRLACPHLLQVVILVQQRGVKLLKESYLGHNEAAVAHRLVRLACKLVVLVDSQSHDHLHGTSTRAIPVSLDAKRRIGVSHADSVLGTRVVGGIFDLAGPVVLLLVAAFVEVEAVERCHFTGKRDTAVCVLAVALPCALQLLPGKEGANVVLFVNPLARLVAADRDVQTHRVHTFHLRSYDLYPSWERPQ